MLMALTQDATKATAVERLAQMVAALGHDLEHPGVNNQFLVSTRHPLATTYNDVSVLENHHVATLYRLMTDNPGANVLEGLS